MKSAALAVLFFFASQSAWSQVFTPTIAGGLGGAGRAAVDGGESSFLNPASVAHMGEYYFGAHYNRGEHPLEGDFSRYALQIADGTPGNIVRGAVSFYRQKIDLPNGAGSRTDQDIQLGFAGMGMEHLAVGLSGHYFTQSGQNRESTQVNGALGLIYTPIDALGLALVGYDIAPISVDSDLRDRRLIPTYALAGQFVVSELLRLRLDLVRPDLQPYSDRRWNVMGGLESFFANNFVFRMGAQALEVSNETNLTVGLGYRGPRLKLDYSFQKDIRSAGGSRHLFDLWLPL